MQKSKKRNKGEIFFIIIILMSSTIISLKFFIKDSQPFGLNILEISSNSMLPIFKKGDFILIKKQQEYSVGDIITYEMEEDNKKYYITHRIIEKYGNEYITKGDANNRADPQRVNQNKIKGKVLFYK